jgi:hypothetical protein
MLKLILTAVLAAGAGASATYATVRLTAVCDGAPAVTAAQEQQLKKLRSGPDLPLTGWPRY